MNESRVMIFKFKDNYLIITNILLLGLMLFYAIFAFLKSNMIEFWLAIIIFGSVSILRMIFTTQSPKYICVDTKNMSMDVKPRFPKKRVDRIYFREVKTINTRILRGKFALVEVNLIFNNGLSKSLFFRPSGGGNFFSFPQENIPPEVLDFTNFLNNLQQGITQWQ